MKLGGFGLMADYRKIKEAGFDYAELDIPEIEALTEKEFEDFASLVRREGFPVPTGARALPIPDPWFFTDSYDPEAWKPYLENACRRAHILGINRIIIGNGKARSFQSEDRSLEGRFISFMQTFCDIARENEIDVILEPLGPKYSNYINTVGQAVEVIKRIGRDNLYTMADLRHMVWSGEPLTDIPEYLDYIRHIHVDNPQPWPERPFPTRQDRYDYTEFLQVLKESGYQGTMTIEADTPADWKGAYEEAVKVLGEVL